MRTSLAGAAGTSTPAPLYGLERLTERPDAPVSIFEGPKKAEAGKRLLPAYACISWTGGANAWHKHDWKPLAGRKVLLWPDADEPGWSNTEKLAALLHDPRGLACSVRIVDTNRMPEGWDVADAEDEGWDTLKLIEWAKPRARDYQPPPATMLLPAGRHQATEAQARRCRQHRASATRRMPSHYRRRCPRMRSPRASRTSITAAGAM
jgi:hypothetical protein